MGPRKTVAYVGNFSHSFCTERHVQQALTAMGHRVIRIQESRLRWSTLPAQVRRSGVDVLMWTRTWDVDRPAAFDALAKLRDAGVPTVSFHLDRWWGLDREYQITTEPFFATDFVFTADRGPEGAWVEAGVNHHWLPPGVSEFDCAPCEPDPVRWPHPVVFVGSHPYPHKEWAPYRSKVLHTVRLACDGELGVYPGRDANGRPMPSIREAALRSLYATAKVVIGDSCLVGGASHYWSDRIPETLGRGGFLIHPHVEGIEEWYTDGEHLALYELGDWSGLAKLVRYWVDHDEERARVAAAGRALVLGRDTYRHRMEAVMAVVDP